MKAHCVYFLKICTKGVVISAVVLGALSAGWQAADRDPPYEYDTSAAFILPDPAIENQYITIYWPLTKVHRVCPGVTSRAFYGVNPDGSTGGLITTYDAAPSVIGVRPEDKFLVRSFMLRGQMPDVVEYSSRSCFRCNTLQSVGVLPPVCSPDLRVRFRVEHK